ncbi:MAG TPA: hypothetical protein VGE39_07140, partial [Prosthecobacter sp.]
MNALEQSGWPVKVGSLHRVAVFQVANPAGRQNKFMGMHHPPSRHPHPAPASLRAVTEMQGASRCIGGTALEPVKDDLWPDHSRPATESGVALTLAARTRRRCRAGGWLLASFFR